MELTTLSDVDRKKKIALPVALLVIMGAGVLIYEAESNLAEQQITVNASAQILDANSSVKDFGVAAGSESLNFGRSIVGSDVRRFVNISTPQKSLMFIRVDGNISSQLEYPDSLYFEGRRSIEIELRAETSGNYTGAVIINAQVPRTQGASRWLNVKSMFY